MNENRYWELQYDESILPQQEREELIRLSQALIAETHGNPQEFRLENPSPGLNLDYYVDRALSEREIMER